MTIARRRGALSVICFTRRCELVDVSCDVTPINAIVSGDSNVTFRNRRTFTHTPHVFPYLPSKGVAQTIFACTKRSFLYFLSTAQRTLIFCIPLPDMMRRPSRARIQAGANNLTALSCQQLAIGQRYDVDLWNNVQNEHKALTMWQRMWLQYRRQTR